MKHDLRSFACLIWQHVFMADWCGHICIICLNCALDTGSTKLTVHLLINTTADLMINCNDGPRVIGEKVRPSKRQLAENSIGLEQVLDIGGL